MVVNKNTSDGYDPGQKNSEDQKFLDFEKPIQEISEKISALKNAALDNPEISSQMLNLEKERDALTKKIYSKISTWQTVQVARHPHRPHFSDYVELSLIHI